jgi:hypothetical protein
MWKRIRLLVDCTGTNHCITHETWPKHGMALKHSANAFFTSVHGTLGVALIL